MAETPHRLRAGFFIGAGRNLLVAIGGVMVAASGGAFAGLGFMGFWR